MEVAPGIFRIESTLGPRPFSQYLFLGERSLLVNTGIASTPDDVIAPFMHDLGFDPRNLDLVLISHADVDHFGGNAAMRTLSPRAIFMAHEIDADWIGDRERILRERYGWYSAHGPEVDYDAETKAFLRNAMGPDTPIDLHLQGGESIRLGPDLTVEVLMVPGHSAGHIGLWEPQSRTAIVIDGILGGGLLNFEGEIIHPPPYFNAAMYEATIMRVKSLRPERLLTAHYDIMEGDDSATFLELSSSFVVTTRAAVEAALSKDRSVTLASLQQSLAPELGPFSSFANELCGPLRAHLQELVAIGLAAEDQQSQPTCWHWIGPGRQSTDV